eukprot:TRINITY_DN12307_c0_g1_i1.p2 TRINITY_DN12307_c0_g1~~TRINITY_DN12307_c0_g1_i1.p2  ORF type:complete len:766 (+),score=187.19 TRINITY_DN12307_c0_g1_i1:2778-5075(+)
MGCKRPLTWLIVACLGMATLAAFPWENPDLSVSERAKALVAAMNVTEAMSQLVTNFGTAAVAIPHLNVPSYDWRSNVLHSTVDNGVATIFPQAIGLAAMWNRDLLQQAANAIAVEQRAKFNSKLGSDGSVPEDYGLNVWGPNINIFRDPRFGRGQETYGEDPYLTAELAVAFITGLQHLPDSNHYPALAATAKHFDGYTLDKTPPRLSFDPRVPIWDLRQTYFPAFKAAVQQAKVASIMCSYNGLNGYPMCASPLLQRILRDEWGFKGFITSDSDAIEFFIGYQDFSTNSTTAAASAINAGVDLNSGGAYYHLPDAYSSGLVSNATIRRAATRLFEARIKLGLFDPKGSVPFDQYDARNVSSDKHQALNLAVEQEAIVLLENKDSFLPLKPTEYKGKTIAVIGPSANDTMDLAGNYEGCQFGGASTLLPNCTFYTALSGMQLYGEKHGYEVKYAKGVDIESDDVTGIEAATKIAQEADLVVLVLGLNICLGHAATAYHNCESEGHDRESIMLPGVQSEFAKAIFKLNKPTVTVLINGGPLSVPEVKASTNALIEAWYGGQQTGRALAGLIFGEYSPSGRLPFTVPASDDDLPDELDMSLNVAPGRGYRYFTREPLYEFGYGLSYTTFKYADVVANPIKLSSKANDTTIQFSMLITNTGKMAGKEVVEVYAVRDDRNLTDRPSVPLKQLIGFKKTDELQPQGRQIVEFTGDASVLKLCDAHDSFDLVPGRYMLYIGPHAPVIANTSAFEQADPNADLQQIGFTIEA